MKNWRAKFFNYFGVGFFILEILFLFVIFFVHCFFWFDTNDAYVTGPISHIALWIQIAMFAFSSIATFFDTFRTEGTEKKRHLANQLSNYKRAILSDAIISLEVNLTKDELYYGVWKNESGEEITFDYEAKTISGKSTWLRRTIAMIQNQSDDIIAYTAVEKIKNSKKGQFDLILMDIQMPRMNGHIAKPINFSNILNVLSEIMN
ncbi:MAG: hypothetical protein KBT21_00170 [Treponema sp.]|nr:hypothetical protein [Candidatus Treponema merdequi]